MSSKRTDDKIDNKRAEILKSDSENPRRIEELVTPELVEKIRTFAAHTNNHLMQRETIGDDILAAAELMKTANEIFTIMEEIKDSNG